MDSTKGYSTPPRSTQRFDSKSNYSQAKLLTSSELKRRFSPIYSLNKKRRHYLIPQLDSLVPSDQHLKMPVILKQLFTDDNKENNLLSRTNHDSLVSYSSTNHFILSDYSKTSSNSDKQTFAISETIIKEKFKILFEKR